MTTEIFVERPAASASRRSIQKPLQLRVFERDGWICRSCRRPVIFAPAMKLLASLLQKRSPWITVPAYYHPNWTRANAPLLDELGGCIDHIKAYSKGGSIEFDNLATLCSKCNTRKGTMNVFDHLLKNPPPSTIKSKYGPPINWDGLSTVFVALALESPMALNQGDRAWLQVLTARHPLPQG